MHIRYLVSMVGLCFAMLSIPAIAISDSPVNVSGTSSYPDAEKVRINSAQLTPDGRWLVYQSSPDFTVTGGGNVDIIIRSVAGSNERRYPAGNSSQGAGGLKMSHSGRWIAFSTAGGGEKQEVGRSRSVLLNVETGERHELENVSSFQFLWGDGKERLMLERPHAGDGIHGLNLIFLDLSSATPPIEISGVKEISVHASGQLRLNLQVQRPHIGPLPCPEPITT